MSAHENIISSAWQWRSIRRYVKQVLLYYSILMLCCQRPHLRTVTTTMMNRASQAPTMMMLTSCPCLLIHSLKKQTRIMSHLHLLLERPRVRGSSYLPLFVPWAYLCGGFILYTGTAKVGQWVAGVFTGSPHVLDLVNKKQADIKELVDYLTTVIKYLSFPSICFAILMSIF
jgi:hypothetical protein